MRLRTRLAASVLAAALPLGAASVWVRADLERRSEENVLREFAVTTMESGGRAACERDPAHFPRPPRPADDGFGDPLGRAGAPPPPPPPELPAPRRRRPPAGGADTRFWAYDADFHSANERAPEMPYELREVLETGADVASRRVEQRRGRMVAERDGPMREAVVRMPWTGTPCDFVLVRRPTLAGGLLGHVWTGALVAGGVLIAVLLAIGPVVRRIRRLEAGVRRSAADRYRSSVEVDGSDEVTDLAVAFNDAGERVRAHVGEVEAREETLRTFVANTTHDLMTPLTVLQGHLDRLRRVTPPSDAEPVRDAMREVDYTTSLVSNLSTAAKLEANTGSFTHAVDLGELVGHVALRFAGIARAAEVELNHAVPEGPVWVRGDDTLLEQALGNVVQNAIRYNRAGGHVAVVLREEPDERFALVVVDDGPGIAEADLTRLTERGYRGDAARTRSPRGHGLGLDIARVVAERHGFELAFARPAEGGLEVTLSGRRRK